MNPDVCIPSVVDVRESVETYPIVPRPCDVDVIAVCEGPAEEI